MQPLEIEKNNDENKEPFIGKETELENLNPDIGTREKN